MIIKYKDSMYQVLKVEDKSKKFFKKHIEYTVISLRVLRQFERNKAYNQVTQEQLDSFTQVIIDDSIFFSEVKEHPEAKGIDYTKFLKKD